jgi:hypothetical protein
MANFTFLKYERVIQIDSPGINITIQELLNEIRDYEDELVNLDYGSLANAFGKQSLGGGSQVGITLELINDWRVQFEARPGPETIACSVTGGNLVALNQYGNNPIKPSAFTQVTISQSSSPTIIQSDADYNVLYLLESLRNKGGSSSVGNIFYWDPVNGSDDNSGTTPNDAKATFVAAQGLATAGNNDIVFALSTDPSGVTTVSETLSITVPTLKVRGPGYPFQLVPGSPGVDTVSISADSVEFSGFYLSTAAGGSDNGLTLAADNALIKDIWIKDATANGLDLSASSRSQIDTCAVEDCAGVGISLGAGTSLTTVRRCIVSGNGDDGVSLTGASLSNNIFENNLIFNNGGYGIDIDTGVTRTGVRLHHTFSGNTSGATRDLGTQTFIETPAGGASASDIADAVWDELIADHTSTGSAGRTLKDTKTKATLASIT